MVIEKDIVNREKLQKIMNEKGHNITTLAAAAGLTRYIVSNFMRGMTPSYRMMKAIAQALEMTPEQAGQIFFDCELRDT